MPALKAAGCPVGEFDYHLFDPKHGFNISDAANELHPTETFTPASFWGNLGYDFWANAPVSQELPWLLGACEALVGRENICVLTAIPPKVGDHVASAKVEWIYKNLPPWLHEQFLIGTTKRFCARPGALLIDDADHNVNAFWDASGQAILFPRPWNMNHGVDVQGFVTGCLMRYAKARAA
jgi:hypothetical protein